MKFRLLAICIVASMISNAQNLIPNGSFEDILDCSTFVSENVFNDWRPINNFELGVNYFTFGENCGINLEGVYDCPAQDGVAYVGIRMTTMTSTLDYEPKNYVFVELPDSLAVNTCYTFKCYLRRAESIGYFGGNKFGAWFSHSSPPEPQGFFDNVLIDTIPQVLSQDTIIFSEAEQWVLFEQNFEVSGGEKFMTLGAFQSIAEMDLYFYYFEGADYNFTLFVDNISVTQCVPENIETQKHSQEVMLYPNPAENSIYINNIGYERYEVYDSMGQQMLSNDKRNNLIDCSRLPSGLYVFKFYFQSNEISYSKVLVQH